MGQLVIHDLDDALLVQLKRQAWQRGLPLQEFLYQLLKSGTQERASSSRAIWLPRPPWVFREEDSDRPRRPSEPSACSAVAG